LQRQMTKQRLVLMVGMELQKKVHPCICTMQSVQRSALAQQSVPWRAQMNKLTQSKNHRMINRFPLT